MNNPLAGTDPSGYSLQQIIGLIIAGFLNPTYAIAVNTIRHSSDPVAGILTFASSAAFSGFADTFEAAGLVGNPFIDRAIGYGVAGGVTSTIQGGQFGHGFRNAATTGLFSMTVGHLSSGFSPAGRTAAAAIAGGTVSVHSGGKFFNGAMTQVFSGIYRRRKLREEADTFIRALRRTDAAAQGQRRRIDSAAARWRGRADLRTGVDLRTGRNLAALYGERFGGLIYRKERWDFNPFNENEEYFTFPTQIDSQAGLAGFNRILGFNANQFGELAMGETVVSNKLDIAGAEALFVDIDIQHDSFVPSEWTSVVNNFGIDVYVRHGSNVSKVLVDGDSTTSCVFLGENPTC